MNIFLHLAQFMVPKNQVNIPQVSADTLLESILNGTFFIAGIIAVVMIIIGGYQYVTSAGDPSSATKARKTILYAIVGLVVSLSSFTILQFVRGVF